MPVLSCAQSNSCTLILRSILFVVVVLHVFVFGDYCHHGTTGVMYQIYSFYKTFSCIFISQQNKTSGQMWGEIVLTVSFYLLKWQVEFGRVSDCGHAALSDWRGCVPLTPVWHGQNRPSDSPSATASPPAPSSRSPCVTEHLPHRCRVSSLALSPHSTSPCCHWVNGGKKKKSIAP